jgi:predicted nucleic acid-binding protein
MKLTKENKEKIDNWFKDKSKEELEYIFDLYFSEVRICDNYNYKDKSIDFCDKLDCDENFSGWIPKINEKY